MNLSRTRKAVSPIIATVLVIAITLIAAVAIGGFVFGLFGTATSNANLSIQTSPPPSCSIGGTATIPALSCVVYVQNTGASAGGITAAGPAASASFTGPQTIPANSVGTASTPPAPNPNQIVLTITVVSGQPAMTVGQTVQLYLVQSDGPNLAFTVTVGT